MHYRSIPIIGKMDLSIPSLNGKLSIPTMKIKKKDEFRSRRTLKPSYFPDVLFKQFFSWVHNSLARYNMLVRNLQNGIPGLGSQIAFLVRNLPVLL